MGIATVRAQAIAVALVAISVLSASPSNAQTCSAAEDQTRARYEAAALQALMRGDMNGYRDVKLALDRELSSACQRLLDEVEPMRVRCSAQEKNVILQHFNAAFQAAQYGDVMRVLDVMLHLESAVSQQCWVASNRNIDPRVMNACTGQELDHLASFAGPTLRMTRDLLTGGNIDLDAALSLGQRMTGPLSQRCNQALAVYQQANVQTPNNARSYGPNNVIDHGGGTYSVPGTGACTSAGCIAY